MRIEIRKSIISYNIYWYLLSIFSIHIRVMFFMRFIYSLLICLLFSGFGVPCVALSEENGKMLLSISDAVFLSLRNNRSVKSAYLNRIIEKFNLVVAEDRFHPQMYMYLAANHDEANNDADSDQQTTGKVSMEASEEIVTGGVFQFLWESSTRSDYIVTEEEQKASYDSNWNINFTQPLLKGGGYDIATAERTQARLQDNIDALSLKETVENTITETIVSFREYVQAEGQLTIARQSLIRAKNLFETNRLLIANGRMAAVELIQAEADVANKEFAVLTTENDLDQARLSLIKTLDIDQNVHFSIVEETDPRKSHPDLQECQTIAFHNRTDYLQDKMQLEQIEISEKVAENNTLWDLSAKAAASSSRNDSNYAHALTTLDDYKWSVGVNLEIPLHDLAPEQQELQAQINVRKAVLTTHELEQNIKIFVQNSVREVEMKWRQYELAKQSTKLAETKLETENLKLHSGRTTNFQVVIFQNDLVRSQVNELNSLINYRNSLTQLDKTLGTTLVTWQINLPDFHTDLSL